MTIPQREGKHTPFPWTVQKTSQPGQSLLVGGDIKEGNLISLQMSTANANIIADAVNSHESLIQLLKSAHEIINDFHKDEEGDICTYSHGTRLAPCSIKQWLASYGKIKGE